MENGVIWVFLGCEARRVNEERGVKPENLESMVCKV